MKVHDFAVQFEKVSLVERRAFYASFHETPSSVTEADLASPDTVIVTARTNRGGKLIGILRGRIEGQEGLVQEIAVHRDHRGKQVGKAMREVLIQREPTAHWLADTSLMVPALDRQMAMVRTIHALSLVVGFREIADACYHRALGGEPFDPGLAVLGLVLALTGIRFFWAPGNIRRYVLQRVTILDPPHRRWLVLVYLPLLFLHAVLFYGLARIYGDMCRGQIHLGGEYSHDFIVVYAALLALNTGWLFALTRKRGDRGPERTWMINNAIFALLALLWVVLRGDLHVTSGQNLGAGSVMFLLNSAIDLAKESGTYILGDTHAGP